MKYRSLTIRHFHPKGSAGGRPGGWHQHRYAAKGHKHEARGAMLESAGTRQSYLHPAFLVQLRQHFASPILSLPLSPLERRWCISYQDWHPFSTGACCAREDHPERYPETGVGIPCTYQHLYQLGWPCALDAAEEIWCGEDGFRNFCSMHAARIKTFHRIRRQAHGREAGHQIAVDALVALASAPYPVSIIDGVGTAEETCEAKEDFDRAARQELLKIIRESIADSAQMEQVGVRELTVDEGRALFREQCWRYMNMSAEEFARKWHAGEFDGDPDRPEVMRVVMLLPLFDRRKAP